MHTFVLVSLFLTVASIITSKPRPKTVPPTESHRPLSSAVER